MGDKTDGTNNSGGVGNTSGCSCQPVFFCPHCGKQINIIQYQPYYPSYPYPPSWPVYLLEPHRYPYPYTECDNSCPSASK